MVQPYNYMLNVPDPTQSVMGGIQQGLQLATAVDKFKIQQQKREEQAALQTELASLAENPTTANVAQMMVKYPSLSQQFQSTYDVLNTEQREERVSQGSRVYAALKAKRPDLAISHLEEQATAYENSNRGPDAKILRDLSTLIQTSPETAITSTGLFLAHAMGAEKFTDTFTKLEQEQRTADSFPTLQAQKKEELSKAGSDAEKAAIEAKYAEQIARQDLKNKAADLGLTKAQTGSVLATTKKLGVETAKAAIELEALKAIGGLYPTKTFEHEEKIRKEWQGRSKMYNELQGTFNTLQASANSANGPGDIALITGFMKMLDPGSVVRETEFATARDTAGLFTQLQNRLGKAKNGQLLSPKQRSEYVALSKKYLESAQKKAVQDKKDLGLVVQNYRLNPENVFGQETAEAPAAAPAAGAGVRVTIDGKVFTFPNQQAADAFKQKAGIQ